MTPAVIQSLDQEGRGIARLEGKVVFIEGALPGELVTYNAYRKKPNYELAHVVHVIQSGFMRVTPKCKYFGVCGGCSMQHLEAGAQVAAKQRVLEDNLRHIGKVKADYLLPAIYGPAWGYRHRARLSVRYVAKKSSVLVGFHEKRSRFVADMESCEVLPPRISALIVPLRLLVNELSLREKIPQIEVAVGMGIDVLVFRVLDALSAEDEIKLRAFADQYQLQIYLQPGTPDTARPFYPANETLHYTLPEFNVVMPFKPTEFTQVNSAINRVLVRRALNLLELKAGERVLDLFCGLGNFTLPIARYASEVVGIEGSQGLVERARENAALNGLADKTRFIEADLFNMTEAGFRELGAFDKILIDPPREGAIEVVNALSEGYMPSRIVYVSCNPGTLARDAEVLVHTKGYRLSSTGIVNMFPHTAHVESIAVFDRQ